MAKWRQEIFDFLGRFISANGCRATFCLPYVQSIKFRPEPDLLHRQSSWSEHTSDVINDGSIKSDSTSSAHEWLWMVNAISPTNNRIPFWWVCNRQPLNIRLKAIDPIISWSRGKRASLGVTDFSRSPDMSPNSQFVFVQIVRRIGGGQLGMRLHSPIGQITRLGEIRRIVGWQLGTLSFSPIFLLLLALKWISSWQLIN